MAEVMLAASSFIQELLYISQDIVWKDEYTAQQNEDTSNLSYIELYMAAMRGELNFTIIQFFDYDVLVNSGLSTELATAGVIDKSVIPEQYRDTCVRLQGNKLIASYEEPNNYYRMLYGLPDVGDTSYVYNTKYPDVSDSTTPVHQLSITRIYELESLGYLDELYEATGKKYLRHLGKMKIEPYYARIAERFSILYMNTSEFTKINNDFRDTYNSCRNALLHSFYDKIKIKENPLYDNFMAMCVLFMSVQQMLAKYLDADITRDFYDYESLKYVYDSYGVPFYSTIPLEYHVKIIKNINILMRYKGSTTVFFKLFDIFNFGSMDVFDFYIMKVHRFENDKPVFKYNADGTENKKAMYELKFGQVQLYNNPPLELSDPTNHIDYDSMTALDPYWITDEDLLDKLYNTEFNYIESKYIGIRTVFDLMNIAYESAYFFKMIIDNKDNLYNVSIYYSALNSTVNLFTLIIYACALICKRYGYEGRLDGDAAYIAKVMGFDFKQDLATVRADILSSKTISGDTELLNLLLSMNVDSLMSVNQTIEKIGTLSELFTQRKISASDKETYQAYNHLERVLLSSKYAEDVFKKSDGAQAESFGDLLGDISQELYIRYQEYPIPETDTEQIDTEIASVLVLLSQSISNLKYIEMCASSSSNIMLEHLFKLLEFFKSAKSELTGYAVSYKMAKRGESMLKFFGDVYKGNEKVHMRSDIEYLVDQLYRAKELKYQFYYLTFKDKCIEGDSAIHLESVLNLIDQIEKIEEILTKLQISMPLIDILHRALPTYYIEDLISITDDVELIYEKIIYEGIEYLINDSFEYLTDVIYKISSENRHINKSAMKFSDKLSLVSETLVD